MLKLLYSIAWMLGFSLACASFAFSQALPEGYFFGAGSQNYMNPHNWAETAIVVHNGKIGHQPIKRYYDILDEDIEKYHAAGIKVIRAMINVDGAMFWKECDYSVGKSYNDANDCYDRNYAQAHKDGWQAQTAALAQIHQNPFVAAALSDIARLESNGFHVIIAPNDFFWGGGKDWTNSKQDPLLHRYLERDLEFRHFYVAFAKALAAEIKARGLGNSSFQSVNETRFCNGGRGPTAQLLMEWQSLEREIFDAVRLEAPEIGLVSTAICTAGDQFFANGKPYSDLGSVMPIHKGLKNIVYAIHFRNPRLLTIGGTAINLKQGTKVHYPFAPMPLSAAGDHNAQVEIGTYNRDKPSIGFYKKVFSDIAAFAKEKDIRVIISEFDVMKPDQGLERQDRIAFIKDIVATSRENNVSMIYMAVFDNVGLSSCKHNMNSPDHRFDPAIMNLLAWGNGVPEANPGKAIEPLEVQCGHSVVYNTSENRNNSNNPTSFDTTFVTKSQGLSEVNWGLMGSYAVPTGVLIRPTIMIGGPSFGKTLPAAVQSCTGVQFPIIEGRYHIKFSFENVEGAVRPPDLSCVIKSAPADISAALILFGPKFQVLAHDIVASGNLGTISNANVAKWLTAIDDGTITVLPSAN